MSNVLSCQNVCKNYNDGSRELKILTGVNLEVHEGEILAISGPSGVGKSTLLHIMGTLDTPSEGEVSYRGKGLTTLDKKEINRIRNEEIGFVFQFYHLLPELTVIDNVVIAAMAAKADIPAARTRAADLLDAFGLGNRLRHRPVELSGGERQRVAIARALINEPAALLADEPTGNLDRATGESILEAIVGLRDTLNQAIVMVTHDERVAERADRVVRLADGLVEAD